MPEIKSRQNLSESFDPNNTDDSLKNKFILNPNGTSNIKTIQSPMLHDNCYRRTLTPILELLKEFNIVLKEKDVENTEIFKGQISLKGAVNSRIYFQIILNAKTLVPSEMNGKINQSIYFNDQVANFSQNAPFKSIDFSSVERVSLSILPKNNVENTKSRIHIRLEINRIDPNKTQITNSLESSIIFERSKWNKSFKLKKFSNKSTYYGLVLALLASTLCGLSFVLKKRSLLKMNKAKAYYQEKGWWMAHSLMVVGDIQHFIAFFFAPAVLICTVQMLMVIVTAVSSIKILGEKINNYWKLAFASCLGGCLVIIVHVPKEPHITNIETFLYIITAPSFLAYILILLIISIIMMTYVIPKWGKINSLAYAVQSAIFGSVVVIALKGVIITVSDRLFHWLPLTCLVVVAACLLMQLEYLNRALTYYNTVVVTTQYYVLYSALVILGSSLLFEVWKTSTDETILLISLGFSTIALGVLIFAIFQEDNATFDFSRLFTGPDLKK